MSTTQLRLSVVICTYTADRLDDVADAVASVREQSSPVHETIVVVDHNHDLFSQLQARWPDVAVVANAGPRGLSGARNTGVAVSTGDVVAFVDDDAVADVAWAANLIAAYDAVEVIGVGGAVLPAWRAPWPRWLPEEFLWVVGCSYRGQPAMRAQVRNPIGANMSFRREVFGRVGGFNVNIGRLGADAAGCEETEFSIRAGAAFLGGRIVLEPAAVVMHAVTAERVQRSYFRRRCVAEGRSKALVAAVTGPAPALAAESHYATRTLPGAVVRYLRAFARGDVAALSRSLAVVEGLLLTTASFVRGRVRARRLSLPPPPPVGEGRPSVG